MATNTLEFTLKDGSTQILDLSVLANILYIDLVMADGTVLKVPLRFLELSTGESASLSEILTALITANMNNDNVIREMGYRIHDAIIAPYYADDRALEKLKFTKTIEYNIRGRSDEIIEMVKGELPKGISLVKSGDTYKIEGYASDENLSDYSSEYDFDSLDGLSALEDKYKYRQLEFLNIRQISGSSFKVGDIIVEEETGDVATISEIETYMIGSEERTKFLVREFSSETTVEYSGHEFPDMFSYYSGRVMFDLNMIPALDAKWKGYLKLSNDSNKRVSFDDVAQTLPTSVSSLHEKSFDFTLGMRTPESNEYTDTNDYTLKVRQNFDSVRDKAIPPVELPVQKEFDADTGDAYVYYMGDTPKFVPAATWYLPFTKNDKTSSNISITFGQLNYTQTTIDARHGFFVRSNTGTLQEMELLS